MTDFASKIVSAILADVSAIDDFSKKLLRLDFHVHQLEKEMGKIEAFKRELPNCMNLLTDAIERLNEEKRRVRYTTPTATADGDGRAKMSNDLNEKKNWMSSIQLWSTPVDYENNDPVLHLKSEYGEREEGRRVGAFVPFKEKTGLSVAEKEVVVESYEERGCVFGKVKVQQEERKQRRCWSPELHKKFVDALSQLGGPQSATPKQIRELMKVDGLTNDEVKSHLQKYRIHIKRQGPMGSVASAATGGESTVEEDDDESRGRKTPL